MNKRSIIIYADEIYRIGGIETWLYNLTQVLKDHFNVLVLYAHADPEQLKRLDVAYAKFVQGKKYCCDVLLNLIGGRPHSIRAGHIIQMVHANYAELPQHTQYHHWNRVDSFIFVSEAARKSFTYPLTQSNHIVIPNPLAKQVAPKRTTPNDGVMRFMSATRLTEEKGGGRIADFIKQLDDVGLSFRFDIWTTWDRNRFVKAYGIGNEARHLVVHQPKLDLRQEMVNSDYVCQFSDCESFCYTIYEALGLHVPVLVTDWDGVRKVVRNNLNGYIFDMDMSNVDIRKIKNPPHTFGVLPNSDRQWIKYLNEVPIFHTFPSDRYNYFLK